MISINVNGSHKQVSEETTITALLTLLKKSENGIAVAINNTVITKLDWHKTKLIANDNILIIQATQGG